MDVLVVALLLVAAPDRGADRLDDDDLAAAELAVSVACHQRPPFARSAGQSTLARRDVIGTRPDERGTGYESPGIAGSGAIATGLAAVSTTTADTILLARSEASAWRAEEKVVAACAKIEGAEPSRLRVTTDPDDLADCDVVVEAIIEEVEPKGEVLSAVAEACPDADLATTTSSLSIAEIADAAGITGRLFGLHVFNPVPRMKLVEVCFPDGAEEPARRRSPGARRSARPRSRSPTRPASSSTACSSPTSSTRCG